MIGILHCSKIKSSGCTAVDIQALTDGGTDRVNELCAGVNDMNYVIKDVMLMGRQYFQMSKYIL